MPSGAWEEEELEMTKLDKEMSRLSLTAEEDGFSLYEYRPTLLRPLLVHFQPLKFVRRCRYLLEYLHKGHYRVFYLLDSDKTPLGFCVVTPGGRGLKCSTNNDIILGPYFVDKSKRGRGHSKRIIRMILDRYPETYECAYDWIMKGNTPSVRASVSCGFLPVSDLNVVGLLRRPVQTEEGAYTLYRYRKAE